MRLVELVDLLDALVLCGLARRRWLEVSHLMVLADGHGAILQAGLNSLEHMRRLENVEVMAAVRTAALVFSSGKVGQTPPYSSLGFDHIFVRAALKQPLTSHSSPDASPCAATAQTSFVSDLLDCPIAVADASAEGGAHRFGLGNGPR